MRIRGLVVTISMLTALFAAGCDDDEAPTDRPASSPPSVAAQVAVPLADLLVKRFDIGFGPDWMAVDEHGLWVKVDRAPVRLVDLATNEVIGRVRTGYELPLCQGIGAAYGVVYVCTGTDLLRIDPESMRVQARIRLHKEYGQGHIPGAFGRFWVLESDGSTLTGLDPATGSVVSRFKLPVRGFDMTAGPHGLWVACKVDDKVIEVDPDSGEVMTSAAVKSPEYVTAGDPGGATAGDTADDQVWVAGEAQTYRIDPQSGAVLATVEASAEPNGSITQDDRFVYVRNGTDFLIQIDKASGRRVATIASDITTGGDVTIADGDVWATADDDSALIRLRSDPP